MKIPTKLDYLRLKKLGLFNTLQDWSTFEEALESGAHRFCIRSTTGGKHRAFNIPRDNLGNKVKELLLDGAKEDELNFTEWLTLADLIIVFDITMLPDGWLEMTYSFNPDELPVREALISTDAKRVSGKFAERVLRDYLDWKSYIKVIDLISQWPGAVVEFAYSKYPIGILGEPLVIFEVRHY